MPSTNAADIELDAILLKLRLELCKKGHHAILILERVLHANNDTQTGFLNYAEFEQCLARVGLFLPLPQMTLLNRRFDVNSNRSISIAAFVRALTGQLNPARSQLVQMLYDSLPRDADGRVAVSDLMGRFHPEHHPKVLVNDKTASAIRIEITDLIQSFSEGGCITAEHFHDLFRYIGGSIPLDDHRFAETLHNVFRMMAPVADPDSGSAPIDPHYLASVGQVLKEKIRQKTRGQESEALTLTRVFRHFDVDDTGKVNFQEWSRALERFGILMPEKESRALFSEHDHAGEGVITYAKFVEDLYRYH